MPYHVPRHQIPPLIALLVGVVLLLNPLYLYPHAGQQTYDVYISQDSADDSVPEMAISFRQLSPTAQSLFLQALHQQQNPHTEFNKYGQSVIYGKVNLPPDLAETQYLITYQGQEYILEIWPSGPFWGSFAIHGGLLLYGALLLYTAYAGLQRPRSPWFPLCAVLIGGGLLCTGAIDRFRPHVWIWAMVAFWIVLLVMSKIYDPMTKRDYLHSQW